MPLLLLLLLQVTLQCEEDPYGSQESVCGASCSPETPTEIVGDWRGIQVEAHVVAVLSIRLSFYFCLPVPPPSASPARRNFPRACACTCVCACVRA